MNLQPIRIMVAEFEANEKLKRESVIRNLIEINPVYQAYMLDNASTKAIINLLKTEITKNP